MTYMNSCPLTLFIKNIVVEAICSEDNDISRLDVKDRHIRRVGIVWALDD